MSVARSYAMAFFEVAVAEKQSPEFFNQVQIQMGHFLNALEESSALRIALLSPVTSLREKQEIVQEMGKHFGYDSFFLRFLILLTQKKRLSLLSQIREHFRRAQLKSMGYLPGQCVSAQVLSDDQIQLFTSVMSDKLGHKVSFEVQTDPSLLAGTKIILDGVTYDGTLRSQLQTLRDCFIAG